MMGNQNNSLTDYIVETVFEAMRDNTIGDVRNNAATFAFSNVTCLGAVLIGEGQLMMRLCYLSFRIQLKFTNFSLLKKDGS